MAGGTLTTDPITVSGGSISGSGVITGALTNGGTITAIGSLLDITGAIIGDGTLQIDNGATMEVNSTVAASQTLMFASDGTGTLQIDSQPFSFNATISDLRPGDAIDLSSSSLGSARVSSATPSVYDASHNTTLLALYDGTNLVVNLTLKGDYAGDAFYVSQGSNEVSVSEAACYCRGTLIETKRGQKRVEKLKIGDKITTASGAMRPIKWIGRRSYGGRFVMGRKDILPICIKAGALDDGVPSRDLWISPHHAMYLRRRADRGQGSRQRRLASCRPSASRRSSISISSSTATM